jgi:hypothetical protein
MTELVHYVSLNSVQAGCLGASICQVKLTLERWPSGASHNRRPASEIAEFKEVAGFHLGGEASALFTELRSGWRLASAENTSLTMGTRVGCRISPSKPGSVECKLLMMSIMIPNLPRILGPLCAVFMAHAAHATLFVYEATLSGPAEDPPIPSPGTGSALVTYDSVAQTLRVEVSFADLIGNTTVAHIHAPTAVPFAGNVGVATPTPTFPGFPAGVTSGSYDHTLDLTAASSYNAPFLNANAGDTALAEVALATALAEGRAYLNIHSTFSGSGEIRGFLNLARTVHVPDGSSSVALLAAAFLGLFLLTRPARALPVR